MGAYFCKVFVVKAAVSILSWARTVAAIINKRVLCLTSLQVWHIFLWELVQAFRAFRATNAIYPKLRYPLKFNVPIELERPKSNLPARSLW